MAKSRQFTNFKVPEGSNNQVKRLSETLNKYFSKNISIQNLLYEIIVQTQLIFDAIETEKKNLQLANANFLKEIKEKNAQVALDSKSKDNLNNVMSFIELLITNPENTSIKKDGQSYTFVAGNLSFTLEDNNHNLNLQSLYYLNRSDLPSKLTNIIKEVNEIAI